MDFHQLFLQTLTREEEQLLLVRDSIYDGEWQELIKDLEARRSGKPYILKLNSRIEEDLERIDKLRRYEIENAINLGALLQRSKKFPDIFQGAENDT
jgi:hypothetical protein